MSRRILITGASSGLGRCLAVELAAPGVELILTGRRVDALRETGAAAQSRGARTQLHGFDFERDEEVLQFGTRVASDSQGLDVLVHNAAAIKLGLLADSDVADLEWLYRVNLKGPVSLTRCLLDSVRRTRGQFVFINSAAGLVARKGAGFYAATKQALRAVADSLREEVAGAGMTVLSVFPSRMNTPMQRRVLEMERAGGDAARFLQPEAVARIVVDAMDKCRAGLINNISIPLGEAPRGW